MKNKKYYYFIESETMSEIRQFDGNETYPYRTSDGTAFNSRSPGYDSIEELILKQGIPDKPCIICNQPFNTTYLNKATLLEKHMCFSCNLWDERSKNLKDNNLIVDGSFYTIGNENSTASPFRGYGGSKFIFKKYTGEIITSTNVWHGGTVPPQFRELIPNNAEIIN